MRLGSLPSATAPSSGTATISAAGTVASGIYTFTAGTGPTTTTYRGVEVLNASTLTFDSGATITSVLFNQNTGTANIYGGTVNEVLGYTKA